MSEQDSLQGHRRTAAVGFIFVTATIDIMALGIMIPALPTLINQFMHGDIGTAGRINGYFSVLFGAMQFICAPILGMLSDRYGRRRVLLISIFGLGVDFLFMGFAPSLAWLFLGRAISGGTAASFSTANAYIADVTAPQNRAKAYGMMGAAFGLGFTLGPALGGFLTNIDGRLPFFVCAGLALINWLYGFFILPESLPPERREPRLNWAKANPVGSLTLLRSHADLLGLASVSFLFQLAHVVLPVVFVLYQTHRYGFSPFEVGLTMLGTGISNIVVQALLVGPVVKRIKERGALLLGLSSGAIGFAIFAMAPNPWIYCIGIPVFALMGFSGPGLQGLMTRKVAVHEQGQLQGANSALMGIAGITAPFLFGGLFEFAVDHEATLHLPGLPILFAAGLMVLSFLLATRFAKQPPPAEPVAASTSSPP